MLLGLAAGKVGDLVFYRDGGEQRTRTRVIPKNPRSPQQMAQRVRMANVSALYRVLAPVVRDSFSNRPSNQSGYNAFASSAIGLSPFQTREMATADAVLPMPVVIGRGTLPSVDGIVSIPQFDPIDILMGTAATAPANFGAVSQQLLSLFPGLSNGSKITIGVVQFDVDASASDGVDVYSASLHTAELVIDTTSSDTLDAAGLLYEDGHLVPSALSVYLDSGDTAAYFAIASDVDGEGSLQTSFARLALTESAQSLYDGYRTDAALQDAIESYNAGSESILR